MFDPTELDAMATLAAAEERVHARRGVGVDELKLAAHWADLHAEPVGGRDPMIDPGGEGTPKLREYAVPEYAIRAWAYSGANWPEQDWDIFMAEPEHLDVLVRLVGDASCPARRCLLSSLYCTVGHSDHGDPRTASAVEQAGHSSERWLTTWAARAKRVREDPQTFHRDDWCGWDTFAETPVG